MLLWEAMAGVNSQVLVVVLKNMCEVKARPSDVYVRGVDFVRSHAALLKTLYMTERALHTPLARDTMDRLWFALLGLIREHERLAESYAEARYDTNNEANLARFRAGEIDFDEYEYEDAMILAEFDGENGRNRDATDALLRPLSRGVPVGRLVLLRRRSD